MMQKDFLFAPEAIRVLDQNGRHAAKVHIKTIVAAILASSAQLESISFHLLVRCAKPARLDYTRTIQQP
jgi:hypothetical protein